MPATGFRRRVFVVMPFGRKAVPKVPQADAPVATPQDELLEVNFDDVYQLLFKPALNAAGLQPFRADDEQAAGNILKDMFAELVTADIVLADISILNANVFYELGVRHGIGPRGVICLHAGWAPRPFDVAPERTFRYDGQLFRVGRAQDEAWKEALEREKTNLAQTIAKAVAADRTTEGSPVYSNLPNLKPVDASRIDTARFKFYQALAKEWQQRVEIAGREGRAEDILTLAGDVPSPYYRRKLLRQCGDALLALCRYPQAEKIYEELLEDLAGSNSMDEFRVKCLLALIANRRGRVQEATVKLTALANERPGDPEAQGLLGQVYKDMWRAKWAKSPLKPLEERIRLAGGNAVLGRSALASYEMALRRDIDSYYNGINVVTLAALLDHVARANKKTFKSAPADFDDVVAAVRLAAAGKLDQPGEAVWAQATLGELHLILGHAQEALDEYEQASASPDLTWFNIRSMLDQVELLELVGFQTAAVEPVAKLLRERCDERVRPRLDFNRVTICSGHMIDRPGRSEPRFPPAKEAVVLTEIQKQLAAWNIGSGDLAVCSAARGADILFAEECLRRGAHVRLLLAEEIDPFVENSVRLEKSNWVERFHALCKQCEVATQPERLGRIPAPEHTANASQFIDIHGRTNLWIINTARVEAAESSAIHALLVWDEEPTGDGPGGTSDFEARVRQLGGHREIINPKKLTGT